MSEQEGHLIPVGWRSVSDKHFADIARAFRIEPWRIGVGRRPPFPRRLIRRLTGKRYQIWP